MAGVQTEQPKPFDAKQYIADANAREVARNNPSLPRVPQPEVRTEAEPAETLQAARQVRRAQNRLREALGEERGRRLALEEVLKNGAPAPAVSPVVEDPEPQRPQFKTDAEYNRALGRWDARQEANKVIGKVTEEQTQAEQDQEWNALLAANDRKMQEDIKLIPDWEDLVEEAKENASLLSFPQDGQIERLVNASEYKAFLLAYFVKNPKELQALKELPQGPVVIRNFGRLEAKVEKLYTTEQIKKQEPETAAERDAKKHRPSAADAPRGGSAPVTTISPVLADGKTLNPAWKAQQNERLSQGR